MARPGRVPLPQTNASPRAPMPTDSQRAMGVTRWPTGSRLGSVGCRALCMTESTQVDHIIRGMTVFDRRRLAPSIFKLDVGRMRDGWYSDKYFINIVRTLADLARQGHRFGGTAPDLSDLDVDLASVDVGSIEVEMQWFPRRRPSCVVVGIDKAVAILAECTGYFDEQHAFVNTFSDLEVWAVHDGSEAAFDGDPENVTPVLRVK